MVPPDARAAFDSGQLDAWMVWPPWPEQELVEKRAKALAGTETPIHSIVVARNDFLQEHPDLVQGLVTAIDRAKKWIPDNADESKTIVAKEMGLPMNVVDLAWSRLD